MSSTEWCECTIIACKCNPIVIVRIESNSICAINLNGNRTANQCNIFHVIVIGRPAEVPQNEEPISLLTILHSVLLIIIKTNYPKCKYKWRTVAADDACRQARANSQAIQFTNALLVCVRVGVVLLQHLPTTAHIGYSAEHRDYRIAATSSGSEWTPMRTGS